MIVRPLAGAFIALGLAGTAASAAAQQSATVCVGSDRVLRAATTGSCPAGERPIALGAQATDPRTAQLQQQVQQLQQRVSVLEGQLSSLQADQQAADATTARLDQQLRQQQQQVAQADGRISNLERSGRSRNGPLANRVVAPFEVVDQQGKPIFTVRQQPRGFALSLPGGEIVAVSSALPGGGFFKALSADQSRVAVAGVTAQSAIVAVREGDQPRGILALMPDGKTSFELMSDGGTSILGLTQGASGGGLIQLADAGGAPTVEAGTSAAGVGVVRVGPRYNCGGKMGITAPDCIVGRK